MIEHKPRNIWWLFLAIVGISSLGWFINTFSPNSWQFVVIFLLIFFVTSFWTLLYCFNNVRRAFFVSIGFTIIMALRYLQLREPQYIMLLIATLLSLELYFQKR